MGHGSDCLPQITADTDGEELIISIALDGSQGGTYNSQEITEGDDSHESESSHVTI